MIVISFFYVIASISAIIGAVYNPNDGKQLFEDFIREHNKIYSSEAEKAKRYGIFLENLIKIDDLNTKHEYAEFGITKFSDLTSDEFLRKYTCVKFSNGTAEGCRELNPKLTYQNDVLEIPAEFDWRTKNVVTAVKNQGNCGSCWAFSVTGNVESINAIKSGQLIDLSAQQLVDCDKASNGCSGGYLDKALLYLKSQGAMSSTSYPYTAKDGNCAYDAQRVAVKVKDCTRIDPQNEEDMAEKLVSIGPISIAIDASGLQQYSNGVVHGGSCDNKMINHAVLLVGYGTDGATGLPYWLVKNSWAENFGERGYFRMQRGVNCMNFMGYPSYSAVV